jgi:hypothetical protein
VVASRATNAEPVTSSRLGTTTMILLAALLVSHVVLAWQARARGVFTFGDDAAYLLLSRSLRALSYRELQFVGEPIAARFPPGYPALLALCSTLFGERLSVIAIVGILFSVSGIWALFDVVRRRWSPNVGLVVAALVAVNPAMLELTATPVTEPMFTSLALWALWAADRLDRARASLRNTRRDRKLTAAAIVLSIAAALTRSAGVTLPISLFAHWAWRRQWRAAAALALSATVFVGGWLAWTTIAPQREVRLSYIDDVVRPVGQSPSLATTIARRMADNVPTYVTQSSLTLVPLPVTPRTVADNVGWVVVLGGLFLAGWVSAWTRWNAAAIYMVAYCGLLAVWPYLLERFLVPMIPLAITFLAAGAAALGNRLGRWRDAPLLLLGALFAAFGLRADADIVDRLSQCDRTRVDCATPFSLDYVEAAHVANAVTPPAARFIAPKGATLYFHGARQTVFWEEAVRQDSTSFLRYLRHTGVTHILSTPVYGDYVTILQLIRHHCRRFAVVRSFSPHTLIFAFRDSAATPAEGDRACAFVERALATSQFVADASRVPTSEADRALASPFDSGAWRTSTSRHWARSRSISRRFAQRTDFTG